MSAGSLFYPCPVFSSESLRFLANLSVQYTMAIGPIKSPTFLMGIASHKNYLRFSTATRFLKQRGLCLINTWSNHHRLSSSSAYDSSPLQLIMVSLKLFPLLLESTQTKPTSSSFPTACRISSSRSVAKPCKSLGNLSVLVYPF